MRRGPSADAYGRTAAAAAALAGAALLGAALWGLGRLSPPAPTTTRALWMSRETWAGRRVDVLGALEVFSPGKPGEHWVLQDGNFRVGVRGLSDAVLNPLLGRRVRARGVFAFSESYGGYLDAPALTPAPAAAEAAR
ncbi:MAG: hypothetical protein KGM24_12135 [Elusimicrobia bacterium]|nr:hypothetical protein [Elusimicrobiota bacterium]